MCECVTVSAIIMLQVDLCFLVDGTGSMMQWIKNVKECISYWSEQLLRNYKYLKLRLAFVGYTDYDQPEETRTCKLDFTRYVATPESVKNKIDPKDLIFAIRHLHKCSVCNITVYCS